MEQNSAEVNKQKNSNLSILLIIVNIILLLVFAKIGSLTEDQEIISYILLIFGGTVLIGGYAFSYHGKGYRIAKWLFAIGILLKNHPEYFYCAICFTVVFGRFSQSFSTLKDETEPD